LHQVGLSITKQRTNHVRAILGGIGGCDEKIRVDLEAIGNRLVIALDSPPFGLLLNQFKKSFLDQRIDMAIQAWRFLAHAVGDLLGRRGTAREAFDQLQFKGVGQQFGLFQPLDGIGGQIGKPLLFHAVIQLLDYSQKRE
jgi:hypothetical protein